MREWRATADVITAAFKLARRRCEERARVSRTEGWEPRLLLPGVSGPVFNRVWEYVIEGAIAGAGGRDLTEQDGEALARAYSATERAVFASVHAARAQAGSDEARRRRLRITAIKNAPYLAVAYGYAAMHPSPPDHLDVVDVHGKAKPALEIAVLALAELGHANAVIARGLDIDSAVVRRIARSARPASYAEKS